MISPVTRKSALVQANESFVLKKYIDAVRAKQQQDPDYVKWDLSVNTKYFDFYLIRL
jgi:hypothetical protein